VKQQHREKYKKYQFFRLLPDRTVQGCIAAQQETQQYEGKVRGKEFYVIHIARITPTASGKPLCVFHR
jgi:uncharacterized membrane protein YdjX (TVP38/TMEM64 family)